ncbi:MAG: T9SS type B sorting domain-containing protein [Tenacibaculum sp.]
MKKTILLFLLLYVTLAFSQNEANIWYFGRNAGIDFSSGDPVALTNGQLNTFEGASTISDKDGNLLFYSDGSTVWDRNHNIMPNGTGLLGDSSSSQSAIIIPNPTNDNIYYLFTVDAEEGDGNGFRYSIVDLTLNGGNGDITSKNTLLVSSATEKTTAVVGKDCETLWVITADDDDFYAFEVSSTGINTSPIISPIGFNLIFSNRGYLKLSPDGTKLVLASSESGSFIYNFDANTGIITNGRQLDLNSNKGYGVEFSISGNKLYIATGNDAPIAGLQARLYQFDVSNPDITTINNSRGTPFYTYEGTRGALQLGPNGKIYYAINELPQLGVINFPENDKNNINYVHNGVDLNGRNSSQGLPPFVQSYFLPTTILNADTDVVISDGKQFFCAGRDYRLKAGRITPSATYTWEKDGNIIGTDSILVTNDINFGPGIYNLTIELNNACNTVLTSDADIEFVAAPTVTPVPIFELCDTDANPTDNQTTFDLTTQEAALTNNATNVSVDFFAQSDTSFTNPLTKNNYINTTNPETLVVRVSVNSSNNSNCSSIGSITLQVTNSGITDNNFSDIYVCELDANANNSNATNSQGTGNSVYDFTQKINEIINLNPTINLTTHNISFHRTQTDADNNTNAIIAPYNDDFFINNATIYIRVHPLTDINCYSVTTIQFFVDPLPIPLGNTTPLSLCTSGNPPSESILLNADTGNASDTYQWYLNNTLIPNATQANYTATQEGIYKVEAFRSNTQIPNTCPGFNTFTVIRNVVATVPNFELCDADNDTTDQQTSFDLTTQENALTNNNANASVDFFLESDTNFTNPLSKNNHINSINPENLVVRVNFDPINNPNCYSFGSITLSVLNAGVTNTNITDVYVCETDLNANNSNATNSQGSGEGFYDFSKKVDEIISLNPTISNTTHRISFYRDLNDANNQSNQITTPYSNELFTNNADIFVRIDANNSVNCPTIIPFKVFVTPLPIPQGNPNPVLLCLNLENDIAATVNLDASTGNTSDSYQWYKNETIIPNATNAIYQATEAGTYKVEAYTNNSLTENACVGYNTFTVITSSKALIVDIKAIDNTIDNNSITILVEGEGNYEFSLNDNNDFNNGVNNFSYSFYNLPIGIYTITVRDSNGCGVTISDEIPIIFFQKHCTPNEDNIYDTWKIQGVNNDFFQSVVVNIYDRYGKRVAQIPSKTHQGWNGVYNGVRLPSNDYWYHAILIDKNGKKRTKKSHFALLRR